MDTLFHFLTNGLLHFSVLQKIIFTLVVTHITIAAVTIYLHRCQAHRALDLHPIASHFFRFWLFLTTGMMTKQWAAIHRKHHAKCETPEDPHSPQTRGIWKVLLEGAELYRAEAKNLETIEKYGSGTPDDWIEKNLYSRCFWHGPAIMLIINLLLFGVLGVTIFAVQMLWIPVLAAGVVNGVGHYWGYRNYDCNDAATNISPWGLLIGGEELHNNHHTYPTSAKLSIKWYEFDIGWLYIRILSFFKLARVKKIPPVVEWKEKPVADVQTLQAILANRYVVMARYTKSLRKTWCDEIDVIKSKLHFERQSDTHFLNSMRKLLQKEPTALARAQQEELESFLQHSKVLQTMHQMRVELSQIWQRSNATREQLLQQLQQWCERAENSGIQRLRDFAIKLRGYSLAQV